jgi:hypothetical protein
MGSLMRRHHIIALILLAFSSQAFAGQPADPYVVTGIPVQATAPSWVEAQTIAINSGRQKAWTQVYRRLTKQEDWSRQPVLDDTTLARLIASYTPADERRSTTRYSARMTYAFNPVAVRHLLHSQNIVYADEVVKPVLVIPMGPTYQPRSVWATAWLNPKYRRNAVPLFLPPASAAATLAGVKFADADWKTVGPIAAQVKANDAYLALASTAGNQVTVRLKRLGFGNSEPIPDVAVTIPPGTPAQNAYAAVADNTAIAIANAWKAHAAIDYSRRSRVTCDVQIDSLAQWGTMLQKLATVPNVTDVGVTAMNIGEARVVVSYVGNLDQLHDSMTKSGFDFENNDGAWTIALTPPPTTDASTQ